MTYDMKYEFAESREGSGTWRAEAVGSDGECYVVIFSGPDSRQLATEYVDWKNHEGLRLVK